MEIATQPAAGVAATDAHDASELHDLGYDQELRRGLGVLNIAMGFATISPVVGLYAVVLVGMLVAGPMGSGRCRWRCWATSCWCRSTPALLQYPISNGAYQWTRRLVGPKYAWLAGWLSVCAYLAANTTIAYLAAPWFWTLFEVPTPNELVATAAAFIVVACWSTPTASTCCAHRGVGHRGGGGGVGIGWAGAAAVLQPPRVGGPLR